MNMSFHKVKSPYSGRNEAIRNMGGLASLYEKHLARFKVAYADSTQVIKGFLARGDRENARMFVHSVKGLSGTLGLTHLYHSSSDLEYALKSDSIPIEPLLHIYDLCLQEILLDGNKE